jgi:hypothetical protein
MNLKSKRSIEYFIDTAMGKVPKNALIMDGPIRPRKMMIHGLKSSQKEIGHFVRINGTWFEGRTSVSNYPDAGKWARKRRPQPGECFHNARMFCLDYPIARYFEGFYLISEIPLAHAWNVMADGRVLDFTHEAVIRKLKKKKAMVNVRPPLYLGIEVPCDRLFELHGLVGPNEPILQRYKESLRRAGDKALKTDPSPT